MTGRDVGTKRLLASCAGAATALALAAGGTATAGAGPANGCGACGCMDVIFVIDDTGSMFGAIDNIKDGLGQIIEAAECASEGARLRMGLVSFKDTVQVDVTLTEDIASVEAGINALVATGGGGEPEASDEALRYIVTGMQDCASGVVGDLDPDCVRILVMVTDARPAGCDDTYQDGVDDVRALAVAEAAAAQGIKIAPVLVDNGDTPSRAHPEGVERFVMGAYADITDSFLTVVPESGEGEGDAIAEIIAECGGGEEFLDIKPGSCPNSFNRRSQGVLPVALVGTEDLDVTMVDLDSLLLSRADGEGGSVAPLDGPPGPGFTVEDVATPFEGELCDCHEFEGDGIDDLSMKFRTQEVVEALELGDFAPGDFVELVLTGVLVDGTEISAADCLRLVPASFGPASGGTTH